MKTIYQSTLLLCSLLLTPLSVHAAWYSGQGHAQIISSDIDSARDNAISNALLAVVHKAGTSVESVQVVKSGVLEVDELTVRSNGEIHNMRLINEYVSNGYIIVDIEADIYPFSSCPLEKYAKSVFVGPFYLQKRKHAQLGGIYHSDEAIAERLFYKLKEESNKIDPRYVITQQIAFDNNSNQNTELQILDISRAIAAKHDVQYLLFGTIEDMSDYYETDKKLLLLDKTIHRRHFQINIYLVDGINQSTIFQKNYASESDWPYSMTLKFDVRSTDFWNSDYGKIIDENITKVVKDVKQALYCQPTMATIIAQYDDRVIMNIGHRNGVQKGDIFQLIRSQFIPHQTSDLQGPIFIPDDIFLTVVSIQSDRAILKAVDPVDMNNIQIRDMLTPADRETIYQLSKNNENFKSIN